MTPVNYRVDGAIGQSRQRLWLFCEAKPRAIRREGAESIFRLKLKMRAAMQTTNSCCQTTYRPLPRLSRLAAVIALVTATISPAMAQADYPNRVVKMIFGFAAGSDGVARLLAERLSLALGKPVIVENVAGAGGNIAADRIAKAEPDGYTIGLLTNGNTVVANSLYKKLSYDPFKDLVPVTLVYGYPNVLVVNDDVPARNIGEFVALAKVSPGKLTYGSAGPGSTLHLAGELFNSMAKTDLQHVPFRGSALVLNDLLGKQITMSFIPPTASLALIREGKLRPLAVTSLKRAAFLPDIPTMDESGFPGFNIGAWFGLFVPAGTPADIIDKLYRETAKIMVLPDVREKVEAVGILPLSNSPKEFKDQIDAETPYWSKVITDAGIKKID